MNETQQARADLAFMKALVEEGGRSRMTGGAIFLAAGLLYGLQCLVHWTQMAGLTRFSDRFMLLFVVGITAAFVMALTTVIWRDRKRTHRAVGTRALNAVFMGVGLANLALCSVFGLVAWQSGSETIWLLYPVTTCVLLGLAWFVAYMVRKRAWLAAVSGGWLVTSLGLGLLVGRGDIATYVLLLGLALLVLMALPGWAMMRGAERVG